MPRLGPAREPGYNSESDSEDEEEEEEEEDDEPVVVTPPRRKQLEGATSPYYKGRNVYYEKIQETKGKVYEEKLGDLMLDETKDTHNGGEDRKVDRNYLGQMIWSLLDFSLWKRRIQTKVNCLVEVVFDWGMDNFPYLSKKKLVKESSDFVGKYVYRPWKLQYAIDMNAVGGLNYGCLDTIRIKVEGLRKGSTILE